ncbi:MAG: nucleotidyltransferase domain-containing protein [Planctomycetes bacterium]|nr:nucleotidyltransferase domain-containing protein [Planctomycetota bacterium]
MRDEVEQRLREYFAGREDVVAAYLFGSVARDEAGPASDVDVGVLLGAAPPAGFAGLRVQLDLEAALEALLRRPVQVVVLDRAPPDLVHRVLRDGRLVLERDPAARVRFEVRARREYFDVLPALLEYRRLR